MSSTKNPDHEAENPAPMPKASQKAECGAHGSDPEGQQGGKKAKMAPHSDAAPGLEQDGRGNVIPLSQRTKEDQEKALSGRKNV